MSNNLTPMAVVERLIGPPEIIGPICLKGQKAAYAWRRASIGRDSGDFVSTRDIRKLLTYAREHDIPLTEKHLIYGANSAEIDALLADIAA